MQNKINYLFRLPSHKITPTLLLLRQESAALWRKKVIDWLQTLGPPGSKERSSGFYFKGGFGTNSQAVIQIFEHTNESSEDEVVTDILNQVAMFFRKQTVLHCPYGMLQPKLENRYVIILVI